MQLNQNTLQPSFPAVIEISMQAPSTTMGVTSILAIVTPGKVICMFQSLNVGYKGGVLSLFCSSEAKIKTV